MEPVENVRVQLGDVWKRLSEVCGKLWNENSPSAVSLQAIIEEFKSEVSHADQMLLSSQKALISERQTVEKNLNAVYSERLSFLERQIKDMSARGASLEKALSEKEKHAQALIQELSEKERQNREFYDQYLKTAAERDEVQARKMEGFYKELRDKEDSLESAWNARHKTLEAEYQARQQALEKRQEEAASEAKRRLQETEGQHAKREKDLDAAHEKLLKEIDVWESRRLDEEQKLHEERERLLTREQELAAEYKKKQGELQSIKEGLQREIAELVRQYQAKLKEGSVAARPANYQDVRTVV
ncbi:MAG: hypothetical protein KGI84_06285 [Elusimicrobia bacterium]|nr:hypothetical protein [Elusimicrobiota bacterium]